VQWFRYGRRTVSVEKIVTVEAPTRLVYTVTEGLPVKNYRAEITVSSAQPKGTAIRWEATWDNTFMGKMVRRKLEKVCIEVMDALVRAAEAVR
jgi:hypothetical protein